MLTNANFTHRKHGHSRNVMKPHFLRRKSDESFACAGHPSGAEDTDTTAREATEPVNRRYHHRNNIEKNSEYTQSYDTVQRQSLIESEASFVWVDADSIDNDVGTPTGKDTHPAYHRLESTTELYKAVASDIRLLKSLGVSSQPDSESALSSSSNCWPALSCPSPYSPIPPTADSDEIPSNIQERKLITRSERRCSQDLEPVQVQDTKAVTTTQNRGILEDPNALQSLKTRLEARIALSKAVRLRESRTGANHLPDGLGITVAADEPHHTFHARKQSLESTGPVSIASTATRLPIPIDIRTTPERETFNNPGCNESPSTESRGHEVSFRALETSGKPQAQSGDHVQVTQCTTISRGKKSLKLKTHPTILSTPIPAPSIPTIFAFIEEKAGLETRDTKGHMGSEDEEYGTVPREGGTISEPPRNDVAQPFIITRDSPFHFFNHPCTPADDEPAVSDRAVLSSMSSIPCSNRPGKKESNIRSDCGAADPKPTRLNSTYPNTDTQSHILLTDHDVPRKPHMRQRPDLSIRICDSPSQFGISPVLRERSLPKGSLCSTVSSDIYHRSSIARKKCNKTLSYMSNQSTTTEDSCSPPLISTPLSLPMSSLLGLNVGEMSVQNIYSRSSSSAPYMQARFDISANNEKEADSRKPSRVVSEMPVKYEEISLPFGLEAIEDTDQNPFISGPQPSAEAEFQYRVGSDLMNRARPAYIPLRVNAEHSMLESFIEFEDDELSLHPGQDRWQE